MAEWRPWQRLAALFFSRTEKRLDQALELFGVGLREFLSQALVFGSLLPSEVIASGRSDAVPSRNLGQRCYRVVERALGGA